MDKEKLDMVLNRRYHILREVDGGRIDDTTFERATEMVRRDVRELVADVELLQAELTAERERADKAERVMNIMADKDLGLFILANSIASASDTDPDPQA